MTELSDGGYALTAEDRERIRLHAIEAARRKELNDPFPQARAPVELAHDRRIEDARRKLKFKYETVEEFEDFANKPKPWIFKGLIAFNETSTWVAPPGALKSSVMVEMAVHAALRRDWHGFKSKNEYCPGVFYFALERGDLVKRRVLAQCLSMGLTQDEADKVYVGVCANIVDLTTTATVKDVVAVVQNFEELTGQAVGILIFDTFAKLIAAGGGDEDKAAWQGKVFANIQTIKDELGGPHVALVGHTGKDETRGARGSNAVLGDADVLIQLGGDTVKTATVVKANDRAEGVAFSFTGKLFEFGTDEDGDPITVNIVSDEEVTAPQRKAKEPRLSANQQAMFAILHAAGSTGLTTDEWYEATRREAGIGVDRRATLVNIRHALKSKNLVREYADRWTVNHD